MGELWYGVLLPLALIVLACFYATFPVMAVETWRYAKAAIKRTIARARARL